MDLRQRNHEIFVSGMYNSNMKLYLMCINIQFHRNILQEGTKVFTNWTYKKMCKKNSFGNEVYAHKNIPPFSTCCTL